MTSLSDHRCPEITGNDPTTHSDIHAALFRLLELPPGNCAEALILTVTSECPSVNGGAILVRQPAGWMVRAAVGVAAEQVAPCSPIEFEELIAEAAANTPALAVSSPTQVGERLFPEGTRVVCTVPLVGQTGQLLGAAFFFSRCANEFGVHELLMARLAGQRAAHALELAELSAEVGRATEARGRADSFRDQMLSTVGHDLRNPLGAIALSAVLLQQKGGLSGWQSKAVGRIRGSAARMGRIIEDLLSYTRARLGEGIPITRSNADLREITRKTVEELRTAYPDAVVEVSADGDLRGEWDPARLEQMVSNVLSNAIDHGNPAEPVRLALRGDSEAIALEASSRGELPAEAVEHAFEAFHGGHLPHTRRRKSGLGLGLFIAREIARRHGGEISIASGEGATRVAMRLPRHAVATTPAS
ncbi:MAG TPA: HAMP domain-containing sensor histidine kinase [Anaeromyxobacteraceae bacterium]|nr:HAMP domain-containing sensor histidine kinase [Anaeromyxobacteraceae bacterium]